MVVENVETRLFIGNEFVPSKSGGTFQLVDPATEKPTFSVHEADVDDINLAVEYAKKAQPAWAALDSSVRAEALNALAALVKENLDRFAELESISMGVPVSTFKYFGHYAAQSLSSYAAFGTSVLGESSLLSADRLDLVLKQPYGVTCGIIPWNAPLLMATACTVGPSVAAGNAIILKSSEKAPLTSILLAQLVKKCGLFPPGIIQIITGRGPTTGAALASHMEIRKLAFIGSVATGKKVKEMGARSNLKNVTCELGGKSPLLVFEDANIEKAANEAALSIGLLSGQTCVANSRVYVQESIRDKFVEAYKAALKSILSQPGNPLDEATTQGPQADILQLKHVMGLLDGAKKDGLKTEMGGGRLSQKGYYIAPTIFTDVPEDNDIIKKEVFGPVVAINTFSDEEDALQKANDTEFGLFASVYTKDISRAIRVAKGLEAGGVSVNCSSTTNSIGTLPFGGWKQSGEGRVGGKHGIDGWLETKTVMIDLKG